MANPSKKRKLDYTPETPSEAMNISAVLKLDANLLFYPVALLKGIERVSPPASDDVGNSNTVRYVYNVIEFSSKTPGFYAEYNDVRIPWTKNSPALPQWSCQVVSAHASPLKANVVAMTRFVDISGPFKKEVESDDEKEADGEVANTLVANEEEINEKGNDDEEYSDDEESDSEEKFLCSALEHHYDEDGQLKYEDYES